MLQIRLMTEADLPLGMRLKTANGWNQTEADWRLYLQLQPDGCFVAMVEGTAAGTLTTCIFGRVAWIAMVLVDADYRGRGIGTGLMRHALKFLESRGVESIRLDATPLGQPIYEKLGFVAEYPLHRYEGILQGSEPEATVEPLIEANFADVLRLDQQVTKTDRRKLLPRWASEFPDRFRVCRANGRLEGFYGFRPGARATQVGPCIATAEAGRQLLNDAGHRAAGQQVFIDIPESHEFANQWAREAGLTPQRRLLRMGRGPRLQEQVADLWASSGPEMG